MQSLAPSLLAKVHQVNDPDRVKTRSLASFDAARFWMPAYLSFISTREIINLALFDGLMSTQ